MVHDISQFLENPEKNIKAVQEAGYEAIMINCNPETVSTDFFCINTPHHF